jgi:hypothetical protein
LKSLKSLKSLKGLKSLLSVFERIKFKDWVICEWIRIELLQI